MKKLLKSAWIGILLGIAGFSPAEAQSKEQKLLSLSQLVKKEGEVFVAVDKYYDNLERTCTVEDYFNNQLTFQGDVATIQFLNHTESPCERTFLRTEADFAFNLNDLDPARLMLVQKKYNLGKGKLSDGQDSWFEIHFFTQKDQPLITRKDKTSSEAEQVSTVRVMFKSQEGAKQAMATLRSVLAVTRSH